MKTFSLFTFCLGLFFSFALFSSNTGQKNAETNLEHQLPQQIHAVPLADRSFDYAGEPLPMDNFDVVERLDREILRNSYYHSNTLLILKRLQRYFPVIEPILAEHGVPNDLKYLAVIESDLTNARSPAGARGMWQFMRGTAGDYKLEVNKEIDERYNIEKATHAACRYLKKYKEKFGSWTLAAAAYNMGARGLQNEMNAQHFDSYYDLNLNEETGRYVFRIVAIKEILNNPENYGFNLQPHEAYPPLSDYSLVEVDGAVPNWGEFAKKYGTTYRMIKVYNPWLLSSSLTNASRKKYLIKLPRQ